MGIRSHNGFHISCPLRTWKAKMSVIGYCIWLKTGDIVEGVIPVKDRFSFGGVSSPAVGSRD